MAFESKLYTSRFLNDLDRRIVATQITNQDVTITGARTAEVWTANPLSAPAKNSDNSVNLQTADGGSKTIAMDQEHDLSVGIPSVEEFQSSVNMQQKFRGRQLQASEEVVDDYILGRYPDAGTTITSTATTAEGVADKLREAKVALSDKNVPRSNRYAVLSPFYADKVSEAAGNEMRVNSDIVAEGYVGRYQGFDIFESTGIVEDSGKQKCMFGHVDAISMARQIEDLVLIPSAENGTYHGDILKGLLVFGAKTFLPDALGVLDFDTP